MTPLDSDVANCPRCRRRPCACGPIRKPDSGGEVQHVVAAAFEYCRVDGDVAVHVPLPLAQRILAALERDIWTELAAELRERMGQKP